MNKSIIKKDRRNEGKEAVLSGRRNELKSSNCIQIAKLEIIETIAP